MKNFTLGEFFSKLFKRGLIDPIRLSGRLHVRLWDEAGNLKEDRIFDNLVVDDGLEWIADQLADTPALSAMSHMAVGDDNTAAAAGDTALYSELGRVALTSKTQSTNSLVFSATFPPGTGTGAIVEYGIFNDASAGEMGSRSVELVVNKAAGDTMTVDWTWQFNAA